VTVAIPGAFLTANVTTPSAGLAAGLTEFQITHNYNTLISLTNSSGVAVVSGEANDEFRLGTSSNNLIFAGDGNDEFVLDPSASDLAGNVIIGGLGFNDVVLKGVGQTVDLTKATYGTASTGVDAVVGGAALSGETVDVTLTQVASTNLNGGISADGNRAFVAMIGTDGVVNLTVPAGATFVGVMDASGAGFDGAGNALDPSATLALRSEVTSVGNVAGTIARTFTGSANPARQTAALENVSAYVFSYGGKYLTLWTDGTITTTDPVGNTATYVPPATAPSLLPNGLGTVQVFDTSPSHVTATVSTDPASGSPELRLSAATIGAHDSITVGPVSGTIINGISNGNGGDYVNLNASGGNNTIIGSSVNDVFDIGTSGYLNDILIGNGGFNVVTTEGPSDIDLTSGNTSTGVAAKAVQAVVASATAGTQTVEVDISTLAVSKASAIFEAFLGSSASTLTISASKGVWSLVNTFAPGTTPPPGAAGLTDSDLLNTLFGATKSYNAAADLTGYEFERIGAHNSILETVTVYTDATVATMIQSMAQPNGAAAALTTTSTTTAPVGQSPVLAAGQA
jgi:hypothetical protein